MNKDYTEMAYFLEGYSSAIDMKSGLFQLKRLGWNWKDILNIRRLQGKLFNERS